MHRDGPLLQLRFDLPTFPDRPIARWPDNAGVAQVTLDLWGVSRPLIEGWETDNVGTLTLKWVADDALSVKLESSTSSLRCQSQLARISSVKAYATW